MKNGQTISQVFIYMIAAITFAAILFFGYKSVNEFMSKGEQVEFLSFKSDLEAAITEMATKYGSVRIREFSLPAKYGRICFVDMNKPPDQTLEQYDPIAYNFWQSKAEQNVFLTPSAPVEIKLEDATIDKGYLCLKIQKGVFKLRLTGLGDGTKIEAADPKAVIGEGTEVFSEPLKEEQPLGGAGEIPEEGSLGGQTSPETSEQQGPEEVLEQESSATEAQPPQPTATSQPETETTLPVGATSPQEGETTVPLTETKTSDGPTFLTVPATSDLVGAFKAYRKALLSNDLEAAVLIFAPDKQAEIKEELKGVDLVTYGKRLPSVKIMGDTPFFKTLQMKYVTFAGEKLIEHNDKIFVPLNDGKWGISLLLSTEEAVLSPKFNELAETS